MSHRSFKVYPSKIGGVGKVKETGRVDQILAGTAS